MPSIEVSTSLYWGLPTPTGFGLKVSDAARTARALILSFPEFMAVNPIHALEGALKNANIRDPLILNISDGMDIASQIGIHFDTVSMPAQSLAHHVYGAQHAVILQAHGNRAQKNCEKYASEFSSAVKDSLGDVRLVMAIHNGAYQSDSFNGGIQVITFDGGLTYPEMEAYVAQRMVSYTGPGSTNLYRHLVTEYAAYDPALAENLAHMDESHLMALPRSLDPLMNEDLIRWTKNSWVAGACSNASKDLHPLREWYVASHPGHESEKHRKLAEKRYWRACLKSLIPWMEERRSHVMKILNRPLKALELDSGGRDRIKKKVGPDFVFVSRDDLEYSDLFYNFKKIHLDRMRLTLTPVEHAAVHVCSLAMAVRHEIAHLRPPKQTDVRDLIQFMDSAVVL